MDDNKLLQNNLAEATTEQGFPIKTGLPVRREVELEDGTVVTVESVVPEVMAQTLKSHFITPGEKYINEEIELNGVVQNYNESDTSDLGLIEVGKTYKFSLNERINELDNFKTQEEYITFIEPYAISISSNELYSSIVVGETVAFAKNNQLIGYVTNYYVEEYKSMGMDIYELGYDTPGWYIQNPETTQLTKITDKPELTFKVLSIKDLSNTEFTELDLTKYNWLFKSVEEISE